MMMMNDRMSDKIMDDEKTMEGLRLYLKKGFKKMTHTRTPKKL